MDKDSIAAEYALGGLSNNIFASRYISYIPNKGQLITQIEAVLNEWNKVEKEQQKKRRDVLQTCVQIPLHRITDSASNGSVFPVVTEHFSASSDHAFL